MATKETKTSTSKKSKTLGRELYYFYSLGCAWCKKVEPHIETLNKKGYNIIKLDTGKKDNADAKKELQEKFTFNCGTPLLIDPKSGDKICGYRDLNIVQKLADGEKIPEPPRPKSPPPRLSSSTSIAISYVFHVGMCRLLFCNRVCNSDK